MTIDDWSEKVCPDLREALRSVLAIHVENRVDVPRILRLLLLTIREQFGDSYVAEFNKVD